MFFSSDRLRQESQIMLVKLVTDEKLSEQEASVLEEMFDNHGAAKYQEAIKECRG